MSAITITPDKHLAIIFTPRSGSHVLQEYISTVTNMFNCGELFSPKMNIRLDISDGEEPRMVSADTKRPGMPYLEYDTREEIVAEMSVRQKAVDEVAATGRLVVVKMALHMCPNITEGLIATNKFQFINLDRADLLYSLISHVLSIEEVDYHNVSPGAVAVAKKRKSHHMPLDDLHRALTNYIMRQKYIKKYFPNIQTMYYEEFQDSASKLRNLITGIPKQIVSIPYNKFLGNHKDLITNLDEVEDFYEQFVNEHKEYFPQYFGKLPHVKIPASQGRQPRDLSLELTDIREESASENQPFYCE